jgi:cathepsin D
MLRIHLIQTVVAVVNSLSSNFNQNPVSGLMGLAWASLASSGQTPFWETLASGGSLDSALFGVQLTRYVRTE